MLNEKSLRGHYTRYLKPYFTNLLDMAIGQDDRGQIQQLLKKPWNPYIFRHTLATEFLGQGRLTRDLGNQWFGWTEKSNMASTYENFDGHEAAQVLAESFGIVQHTKPLSLPRLRECPNVTCKELNTSDAPFCVKCRVPLTVAGYMEHDKQKDHEVKELKERMNKMDDNMKELGSFVETSKLLFLKYWHQFGGSLTDDDQKRLKLIFDWMISHPKR